jgi:N6-adenosine-specific RNA methylase IME4
MSGSSLQARRLERRRLDEVQPHPDAAEVPTLCEAEYRVLRDDIAARGVQVPLEVTPAGVLLDGRARLRAARELGHEAVQVIVVTPDDDLEYILRAALLRRHLDASQRAALALKLVPFAEMRAAAKERQHAALRPGVVVATLPARQQPANNGRTRDLIACIAGISPRTAQDVITIHDHDPAVYEQILRGERNANNAAREVRQTLRDAQLAAAPRPLPQGPFELIYADPPWRLAGSPTSSRAVENHFPTMVLDEIKAMVIPAASRAVLYLWAVNSLLPEALHVIDAWGFQYRTNYSWVKDRWGLGHWNRTQHELLLVATHGKVSPPAEDARASSVIHAARRRHSQKPDEVYELLERLHPHDARLELFARQSRPGWSVWGNEALK